MPPPRQVLIELESRTHDEEQLLTLRQAIEARGATVDKNIPPKPTTHRNSPAYVFTVVLDEATEHNIRALPNFVTVYAS